MTAGAPVACNLVKLKPVSVLGSQCSGGSNRVFRGWSTGLVGFFGLFLVSRVVTSAQQLRVAVDISAIVQKISCCGHEQAIVSAWFLTLSLCHCCTCFARTAF